MTYSAVSFSDERPEVVVVRRGRRILVNDLERSVAPYVCQANARDIYNRGMWHERRYN